MIKRSGLARRGFVFLELVVSCLANNFDALAGMLAAGKIYADSKMWFMHPPALKVQQFVNSHPHLFRFAGSRDLQAHLDLLVLIGPCCSVDPVSLKEMLNRSTDIRLYSPGREDRILFQRAESYIQPVAAVTTILIGEIRRQKISLTKLEAGLLALGIYDCTDTLTSPITTAADIAAVQHLWESGLELKILRSGLGYDAGKAGLTGEEKPDLKKKVAANDNRPTPSLEAQPLEDVLDRQAAGDNLEFKGGVSEQPGWRKQDGLLPLLAARVSDRFRGKLLLVGQAAAQRKSEIFLVGGVIRDLFLGREPVNDLDLVVIPKAIPLARELLKCLGGKLITYEQLGTATLFLPGGNRLDLATARQEFYPLPGSLPRIEPSSLKSDLYRRDFTINSMACSLIPESFGRLYDYFCGRRDLADGIIRIMYNLSFVDDPLRIVRAIRFEKRLSFCLEDNTMRCMQKAISGRVLEKVSRPRLSQEISAIYLEPDPPGVLKRLDDLGALKFLYPRLQTTAATWRRLKQISQSLDLTGHWNWEHPLDPETIYATALLYDMEEDSRIILVGKLYPSRGKSRRIFTACSAVPRVLHLLARDDLNPSTLVNLLKDLPPEALLLAYSLAENNTVRDNLEVYVNSLRRVRTRLEGNDLIKMGLSPGPIFQRILKELKEAVLDGRVRSLEEERNFVSSFIQKEV